MSSFHFTGRAIEKLAEDLSHRPQTPVTLKRLLALGSKPTVPAIIENAKFLHRELPIRLARRLVELQALPYGMSEMVSVKKVIATYEHSLEVLQSSLAPETKDENDTFSDILSDLYQQHGSVLMLMAQGMKELKSHSKLDVFADCPFQMDFLDRFFMARIGIRVLASHHIELRDPRPGFAGVFKLNTVVRDIVNKAIEEADEICYRHYGMSPEVSVIGGVDLSLPYIPSHLHYCIFELLKNSMRAQVETSVNAFSASIPPIQIVIAEGANDIAVKVSDVGGGIPRFDVPRIWHYAFTTAEPPDFAANDTQMVSSSRLSTPMAGLGYGLPLARLYARSFGGDLSIISMEGHGTDAYLHLRSVDGTEFVPE